MEAGFFHYVHYTVAYKLAGAFTILYGEQFIVVRGGQRSINGRECAGVEKTKQCFAKLGSEIYVASSESDD
jgi:hypothetical protein